MQYNFAETTQSVYENNSRPQLLYIQSLEPESNMSISKALHCHQNQIELIIVESGNLKYMIDHQVYDVRSGDIMVLDSDVLHGSVMDGTEQFSMTVLGIKNLHIKGKNPNHLLEKNMNPIIATSDYFPIIKQYCKLLNDLIKEPKKDCISEAANYINASLIAVLQKLIIAKGTAKVQNHDYNLGIKIKDFIDQHYREDLKLADIAEALHINPYYLSHTFKKLLGYSPIQYMIHRRIGEAQNMLINTDLTITEIALHCGYNNSNYFQVVFNSTVGMPPGKYRKSWRK